MDRTTEEISSENVSEVNMVDLTPRSQAERDLNELGIRGQNAEKIRKKLIAHNALVAEIKDASRPLAGKRRKALHGFVMGKIVKKYRVVNLIRKEIGVSKNVRSRVQKKTMRISLKKCSGWTRHDHFSTDSQVSEATASTSQQLSKAAKKPGQDSPMSPEAPARNEKEEQGISLVIPEVNDYVAAIYSGDGKWYIGMVIEVDEDDEEANISFMVPQDTENQFKWPARQDIVWTPFVNILCKISCPIATGRSKRLYNVNSRFHWRHVCGLSFRKVTEKRLHSDTLFSNI